MALRNDRYRVALDTVRDWSFYTKYQQDRLLFTAFGQAAYRACATVLHARPQPHQCEDMLTEAMVDSNAFNKIARSKAHLQPSHYRAMAQNLAIVVIDENWDAIAR